MMDFREKLKQPQIQFAILIGTLVLFLIANSLLRDTPFGFLPILIALSIVIEIFIFIGMEVKEGAKKHGWKNEVLDTVIALIVAIVIWYAFSFILNTSSPISGVVSCSMLPNLQRGDFVVVQGAPVKAYQINMTQSELDSLNSKAQISYGNQNLTIDGSIFPYCLSNKQTNVCQQFIKDPESVLEKKGAMTYKYQRCDLSFSSGSTAQEPCLHSVVFRGNEYLTNFSNDVVVYQPVKGDLFSVIGDIVHRTMFRIDVDGKTYYLTRGDNNPVLDLQVYDYNTGMQNHPVPQENLRGRVVFRIPYLGYFKLFLSGFFQEDPQCKTQLTFEHV